MSVLYCRITTISLGNASDRCEIALRIQGLARLCTAGADLP